MRCMARRSLHLGTWCCASILASRRATDTQLVSASNLCKRWLICLEFVPRLPGHPRQQRLDQPSCCSLQVTLLADPITTGTCPHPCRSCTSLLLRNILVAHPQRRSKCHTCT